MSDTGRPGQPEQRPGPAAPTHRPAATPQGVPGPGAGRPAWAPSGASAAPEPAPARHDDRGRGRPAWLLPVVVGVVVLLVAGAVAGILLTRDRGAGAAPTGTASTVVLPAPTPATAPVAREATTAFAAALPTTVLQYALASSQEDAERLAAGAVEAYVETLTDGAGGTVTVRAAQLESPEAATALQQQVAATLPVPAPDTGATPVDPDAPDLPESGDVTVGGEVVGTYTVADAGDGTGVAVWRNGTAVLQLTAPLADVLDAYRAYGL
ncbi:MAG: hypothetical protein J7503_06450 [Cellulomonas iranensis]|jgi:hypothetical protein|uniref:Uncharacterized protein n=1 Tax=Cellulomonas iranensis TaxID=76862 RepID=A0ABU0GHM5_9CELL|nr:MULTISPECIES: hypothetical protein [Cellulomonas]MBO9568449.1 hypothetical protein [Cellulomonas iranensis]MDQ0424827.1 hypothetical protein [Cellulomonas iranensis]TFH70000.1 hypothetical protein E4A51_14315 [Cellulomonas sp. HD19AZ1]